MSTSPKETYTVEQFINAGSGIDISYHNLSYVESMSNGTKAPFFNVINDYIDEMIDLCVDIELNDTEFQKYLFKPKLLANDIYNNPELYFVILRINNMADVKQFNRKHIRLLNKTSINKIMTYIYNSEKRIIDEYNE